MVLVVSWQSRSPIQSTAYICKSLAWSLRLTDERTGHRLYRSANAAGKRACFGKGSDFGEKGCSRVERQVEKGNPRSRAIQARTGTQEQHCKTPRRAEQRTELVSDTDANGENRPSTIPLWAKSARDCGRALWMQARKSDCWACSPKLPSVQQGATGILDRRVAEGTTRRRQKPGHRAHFDRGAKRKESGNIYEEYRVDWPVTYPKQRGILM